MTKAVFFGTNEFAARTLEGLLKSPFLKIELVITQPDKPVGRKQEVLPPPVKVMAEKYGVSIAQPISLKQYTLPEDFQIGILEKYGLMIPQHIIDAFPLGIINIHPSILPQYRGPSPFQTALIDGETETGISIMKLVQKMDAGPILSHVTVPIDPDDTALDLEKKLAERGLQLLLDTLPKYIDGSLQLTEQDESQATFSCLFTRDTGKINWNKSATEIYNQYRGLTPWPGVWTMWNDKRLKLLQMKRATDVVEPGRGEWRENKLLIGTGAGSIEVLLLQLEGKQAMIPEVFMNGNKEFNKTKLQ